MYPDILNTVYTSIKLIAQEIGVIVHEIKGESDHVHFILETKPSDTLSSVIGILKSRSSSIIHQQFIFPCYRNKHSRTLWSSSYFICSTGGAPLHIIQEYINKQGSK